MAHVASGALAARNDSGTTLDVIAPTFTEDVGDQIIFVQLIATSGNAMTPPGVDWTELYTQADNTLAAGPYRHAVYWKPVEASDSGATFTFNRASGDFALFAGVATVWNDVDTADPFPATPVVTEDEAVAVTSITIGSYTPGVASHVIVLACFRDDVTDFSTAPAGTDPTLATVLDVETATGFDATFAACSGDSTGAATGARSWASGAGGSRAAHSVIFALQPASGGGPASNLPLLHAIGEA